MLLAPAELYLTANNYWFFVKISGRCNYYKNRLRVLLIIPINTIIGSDKPKTTFQFTAGSMSRTYKTKPL